MDTQTESLRDRTDAKLRFARVHLDELASLPALCGDDFDRAHQESFLFQLLGAVDAFLAELNHHYRLGLQPHDLSLGKLREAFERRRIGHPELSALYKLHKDESSWLNNAKEMRDHSTHMQGVPRVFYVGGDDDGTVKLKSPSTGKETGRHAEAEFRYWLEQMALLIEDLRRSAIAQSLGHRTLSCELSRP